MIIEGLQIDSGALTEPSVWILDTPDGTRISHNIIKSNSLARGVEVSLVNITSTIKIWNNIT